MNNRLKMFFVTGLAVMFLAGWGANQPAPQPTPAPAPAPTPAPQEEKTPEPAPAPAPRNETANQAAPSDVISQDQAIEIALSHAQLNAANVRFEEVELDEDDGRREYEIEFHANGQEYEYEIDAVTGDIISFEMDD